MQKAQACSCMTRQQEMNLCVCVCVCLTFLMCLDNTDLISPGHLEAAVKQITEIYNAASAA